MSLETELEIHQVKVSIARAIAEDIEIQLTLLSNNPEAVASLKKVGRNALALLPNERQTWFWRYRVMFAENK
jgi:hypothetical protein